VLSDKQILEHLKKGEIKLEPFEPSCLNPAGYDLRSLRKVVLKPKHYELVATLETVELGLNVTAYLHIRSSLAREAVIGSFAVVDPGFRGQLTLNLHNVSEKEVTIIEGERTVQIVFHKLGSTAKKGYSGSYQNSKGIVTSRRHMRARKVTRS
jgi:dCTP deaminase